MPRWRQRPRSGTKTGGSNRHPMENLGLAMASLITLPETNSSPQKTGLPKRKRSYSNHACSCAMLVFREGTGYHYNIVGLQMNRKEHRKFNDYFHPSTSSVFPKSASGSMSRKIWFALSRGKELSHLGTKWWREKSSEWVFFPSNVSNVKKMNGRGCTKNAQKTTGNL